MEINLLYRLKLKGKKINRLALITGAAGFIGFHLAKYLLSLEWKIIGLDSFSDYYDINLKKERYKILCKNKRFFGYTGLVQDQNLLNLIHDKYEPKIIIHLAAQAGVRYSLDNPMSYVESNLLGTFHILEFAKKFQLEHLMIASTSSVYGNNKKIPFEENQKSDNPISFYAATKKSNEIMAHSYSHLYSVPTTMIRFFTIYGSWGRPDMALFKFTKNILSGKPIDVYNYGNMKRDFTNVDDLVEAIHLLIKVIPLMPSKRKVKIPHDSISETAPYRVVNIGNSSALNLNEYIQELEEAIGIKSKKNLLKLQDGDLIETSSNINLLRELTGFQPKKSIKKGVAEFVKWYKSYYNYN